MTLETRRFHDSQMEMYSINYAGNQYKLNAHSSLFSNLQLDTCNTMCDDFDPLCDCNTATTTDTEITLEQIEKWLATIKENSEAAANPILKSDNDSSNNTDNAVSASDPLVWIGVGIGVLVFILIIVFFVMKSRSNRMQNSQEGYNYNMQGGMPGMMPGGGMQGMMPGMMPGGGMPGMMPGGGMPGMMPGGNVPGMMPGMMQNMMPGGGMPGGGMPGSGMPGNNMPGSNMPMR